MPDVKLKSMRVERKNAEQATSKPSEPDRPMYPWGLNLNLDNETLGKLGLDRLPPVGRDMILVARVNVTQVSEQESREPGGKATTNRHVGLQITEMGLGENEEKEKPAAQDVLYDHK